MPNGEILRLGLKVLGMTCNDKIWCKDIVEYKYYDNILKKDEI